jgi:hypothetical protein
MVKVDTEGNEYHVLQGSLHFFEKRLIQNTIVEVTTGKNFWKNTNTTRLQVATSFRAIAEAGYIMVSLYDWSVYRTPEAVYEYINELQVVHTDLWLTLDLEVDVKQVQILS